MAFQILARRQALQCEQLDISFPRRGRPSRSRRLERAGQMRLGLHGQINLTAAAKPHVQEPESTEEVYDPEFAAQLLGKPLSEDELAAEFHRLFPPE